MLVLVVSSPCLEQLICMACEKCKTKYLLEIMILVAVVSYLWFDQLICIAREKCKAKYLLEIMMLVVVVSYIIGLNNCYVLPVRSARPTYCLKS
ncbi:hypothetical protein DPMN_171354 [Dreissena polymorpha]|uniref:Uncharacterized protein n=1 Tax=Dreissena polymorpha TaxID=45954 RepID=A0A9D4IE30_DREPO|nr:hypothetical protein DPMN_171354 [Dreissena polymorpha]